MTSPPVMRIRVMSLPIGEGLVHVGPTITVEGPLFADLLQFIHVEVAHDELSVGGARDFTDELTTRTDEVTLPVEVVGAELLDTDSVDGAYEVFVRDRRRRLLELPQVGRQTSTGRRRIEDDLRPGEAECPPPFREVSVVTDIDANAPNRGIEDRVAEVARTEVASPRTP